MKLPDAEAVMVEFLAPIVGVWVGSKVPNPRPARFVRAWRSGGAASSRVVDRPHITVTAWGTSTEDALDLAAAARGALLASHVGMPLVRRVEEVGGLYSDPDPATGIDRYTFTVMLTMRAHL